MTRAKKILFVLASVVLLALLAVWFVITGETFRDYIQQELVLRLEKATGGKVSVRSLELHFFPLRVLVSDVRIIKESSPAPPFLTIRQVEAYPHFESFLGLPSLGALTLREPQFRVEVRSDGSTNTPQPEPVSGEDLFRMLVEKLDVENGSVQYNQDRSAFSTHLEGVALSARYLALEDRYQGSLRYEKGEVRLGKNVWAHGLDLSLSLFRDRLDVERLMLSTPQSKLAAKGAVRNFRDPSGELTYQGNISLEEARPLYRDLRDLQGLAQLAGTFSFSGGHWKSAGTLKGSRLSVNTARVERFTSQYEFSPARLQFTGIQVTGLHGRAEGQFTVESPFEARRYKADLRFGKIGLLDLSLLARLEKVRFAGELSGTLKAAWLDDWKNLSGKGRIRISEAPNEPAAHAMQGRILPIHGELNFALSQWSSRFERSFIQFGQSEVHFVGMVSAREASNLRIEARSADFSDFAFLAPELRGRGNLLGVIEGTQAQPTMRGSFLAENLSYQKFSADQVQGHFKGDRRAIDLLNVDLVRQSSRIKARGKIYLDPARLVPTGDVHLLASLKNVKAGDLWAALGQSYPLAGNITGDFMATGKYPQIELQGVAEVRNARFLDQPYEHGRFEIHYQEPVLELSSLDVQIGAGRIKGSAVVDITQETLRSKIEGTSIPLDQIYWLRSANNPISGEIRKFDLKAEGPYRRPALQGHMEIADLTVAGEKVGDFQTRVQTENQILRFQTNSLTPEVDLVAGGTVDLHENLDCITQLTFRNFVLTPYVKKLLPVAPEKLSSRAEGQLVVSGPLRHPEKLVVSGRLQSMQIDFREARLQAAQPFDIEVRDERVNIKKAVFTGKGTVLNLDGLVDMSNQKRLQLALHGDLDLALLNEFVSKLSAAGNGTVNASVRGTLADPHIQGQARISNGQFAYADFPNSFSQASGNFFFDENQVRIDNFSAVSGGGKVEADGDVAFGEEQIQFMNLRIQGREVRIRYPEGMRNVVDADLALRGSPRAQQLSGNIRIVSASFQKGYDPITQFLEDRGGYTSWPGAKELGGGLSLDLTITGDRNIKLDTQLIKMTSRADLKVKGTAASPLITGSIEASGGELYFQGARYRITRGRLDFVNPVRIDPRIDLEAESDLRDYRIVLTISGTAGKFRADLRSDPPLPTVDLFNLVSSGGAGARPGAASYRPYATSGRQQDNSTAAASALLSEGLSLKVGSGVKRLFGLDRFRVDPFLVGNERDPSARVTFGQQITKDFSITYSTSVSSNEQQIILIEYRLNDSTSVIASRDAEGSFGLDVRFRKRLRQKNR
ncbi:MAG: translocation/assembly module TamB domain-containing protein [Acidobacteria bacterium]|nr:translocation/assembly module TamB domain-containing protein [Acidobacteriota bacterium]